MQGRTTWFCTRRAIPALTILLMPAGIAVGQREMKASVVEQTPALERAAEGAPGRAEYAPTGLEHPFFERLRPKERTTGSFFDEYSITGKKGSFVGWFGIVRGITKDPIAATTELLIENKYFDGSTEARLMMVSFNGAGDFLATLSGTELSIAELTLVRVYGVVVNEANSVPRVRAEYVRAWDWGSFVFREVYGEQKGNRSWKRFNAVGDHRMYHPTPTNSYYEDRLGRRSP